jgi:hypothetical protein
VYLPAAIILILQDQYAYIQSSTILGSIHDTLQAIEDGYSRLSVLMSILPVSTFMVIRRPVQSYAIVGNRIMD